MKQVNIWIPLLLTCLAGFSTMLGCFISLSVKKFDENYLRFAIGISAGVMIYISFAELLRTSIADIGFSHANIAFFSGIAVIMFIDFILPHKYITEEKGEIPHPHSKLLSAGILTAVGVGIHNMPEGLAVFMSSLGGVKLGVALAVAIAIHNIPEGIAIAMPVYYATKSRRKAFWLSFLASIAEPVGALVGIAAIIPFMSKDLLALSFAFAAGIMVFISFDELLPLAYTHKDNHIPIAGIIIGMVVMAISLHLL